MQTALQKGDKDYLKLFEVMDEFPFEPSQNGEPDSYDATLLKKKLGGKISTNQLHVTKNYLHGLILKSLRSLNEKSNAEEQLAVLLAEARILEQKGLYEQTQKKLNIAKNLALKFERHREMIDILFLETALVARHKIQDVEIKLNGLYEAIFKHLAMFETEIRYKRILNEVTSLYRKGVRIRDELGWQKHRFIFNEELLRAEVTPITFLSKISFHYTKALVAQLAGKLDEAIKHHKNVQDTWVGYPHFKIEYPLYFIIYTSNFLIACHLIRDYSPFPPMLKDLKKLPLRNFDEQAEAFQNIYFLEQLYFMNKGIFEVKGEALAEAVKLANDIEKGLQDYAPRIVKSRQMTFFHNTAVMFFALAAYDDSLTWLAKIQHSAKTDQRKDLQLFARLLQLIIFLEKGEHLYIDNAFKAFEYHLKKEDKQHDFEGKVTSFLKQVAARKEDKRTIFTKFQYELQQFEPHKIQGYEEISIWVESKLTIVRDS